jgi:hypothetical protein
VTQNQNNNTFRLAEGSPPPIDGIQHNTFPIYEGSPPPIQSGNGIPVQELLQEIMQISELLLEQTGSGQGQFPNPGPQPPIHYPIVDGVVVNPNPQPITYPIADGPPPVHYPVVDGVVVNPNPHPITYPIADGPPPQNIPLGHYIYDNQGNPIGQTNGQINPNNP